MAQHGHVINWLVTFIGDRHTVTRQEVLKAQPGWTGCSTVRCYMTTSCHYGHVLDESPHSRYDSKRIAYLKRVKRGVYTLTEKGWARYRQVNKVLEVGDLSGSMTKSELACIWADLNGIPMVTIRVTELTEEDLSGLPVIRLSDGWKAEDDRPDHCDYGLL